jgi:hypothetical protein
MLEVTITGHGCLAEKLQLVLAASRHVGSHFCGLTGGLQPPQTVHRIRGDSVGQRCHSLEIGEARKQCNVYDMYLHLHAYNLSA